MKLCEADVVASFDAYTVSKGKDYVRQRRVVSVTMGDDGLLHGLVQGTRRAPYAQTMHVRMQDGYIKVSGECTCPMELDCKHVVAAALVYANSPQAEPIITGPSTEPTRSLVADPAIEDWLRRIQQRFAPINEYPEGVTNRMLYCLKWRPTQGATALVVELLSARSLKEGGYGKATRFAAPHGYATEAAWPRYILPIDKEILSELQVPSRQVSFGESRFRLEGTYGAELLRLMLQTERCHFEDLESVPMRLGDPRPGQFVWEKLDDGSQRLKLKTDQKVVFPLAPPFYFDADTMESGPIDVGVDGELYQILTTAPSVRPEHAQRVHDEIGRMLPDQPSLQPDLGMLPEIRVVPPTPKLRIRVALCSRRPTRWSKPANALEVALPIARLECLYDGVPVNGVGNEVRHVDGNRVVVMPRDVRKESEFIPTLKDAGWEWGQQVSEWKLPQGHGSDYAMVPQYAENLDVVQRRYYEFLRDRVPQLREQGWLIDVEDGTEVPTEDRVQWRIEASEGDNDWFGLNLGITVDGERFDLRPILVQTLQKMRESNMHIATLADDFALFHRLANGKVITLWAARLRPLVEALFELFGEEKDWPDELGVPAARAHELAQIDMAAEEADLEWQAPERLKQARVAIQGFDRIRAGTLPKGFVGEMRSYQLQGLGWLQFLRKYGFGGILADDMGLGKTIQAISHILTEKAGKRLDRPTLIVAPTSTIPNWKHELEKFAPSLKVLVLHGSERREHFDEMSKSDVVLTSYALLHRDRERYKSAQFHIAILDEAQNIKNATTGIAKAAFTLPARHRLCLTGTPVENNLGELWSLYNFLMPGLLGTATHFKKTFRTPIEHEADAEVRQRLAKRIRPFVLRRTKDQVAKELPPKTTIIERIELSGKQRDLYESLRLAMDKQVRELIANKGFDRSRIEILEALLRLRQVCCDPRLLKQEAESAKLERVVSMVADLIAEGRRILLFSQFTSMLDLIEDELRAQGLEWVRISGDTQDRDTPVRRFQSLEVPLFLISLRAGGTGLNLTAADTVIHYDPWWNPAVENQATDRAHRIGQKRRVFVYKLVAAGTVEEKILNLQEEKATLAGALLDGAEDVVTSLSADDLKWVLAG